MVKSVFCDGFAAPSWADRIGIRSGKRIPPWSRCPAAENVGPMNKD